ncbi:DUF3885 domain-containing protein [Paenibacillus guangzhouensis]|uniref:DUF3885 domain-containing protein n=1 Tax=Paenibacillus guangzhouensis TaxID=1473112 RepID=UPI00187BACDA|nr:DUF3885 domain-containing protein [Paenibacillus guangzhouensis]
MKLNQFLEDHFPNLKLIPPIFYGWDYSIRFELGNPPLFRVNKELYMEQVYYRSLELFKALHDKDDELLLVTSAYFADIPKNKVKKLNLYKKYIKNKDSLMALNLEILPDIDLDPDEIPDPRNNMYRYWTTCKVKDLRYSELIKSICNHDVGIRPMIYHRVYFINISKRTIFHIYDDRGCDVISESKDDLIHIYTKYNSWILDYDRERIDKTFL